MLTGSVPRPEDGTYAECLAWSTPAVRSVANEIVVGAGTGAGAGRGARDAWITQRVRARLLADDAVRSVNYNVETRERVVHLLGYARSEGERDRAAAQAALVDGVERVVVLVRVEGEAPDLPARGERRAALCDSPQLITPDPRP